MLTTGARRFRDREALYCSSTGRRLSFGELNTRVNRLANALNGAGFRKGDVVGFLIPNRAEIVELYYALAKTGIVGVPLNYRLAPAEMADLLAATGATGFVCDGRFAAALATIRCEVPGLRELVWIGASAPAGCTPYEDWLSRASDAEPEIEVDESDPYYFNLTSGTTGLPKAYVVTHYNAATSATGMLSFGVVDTDVVLVVFPLFGRVAFGWVCHGLSRGVRCVLADFQVERVLQLIAAESITYTMLVPTMAAMLLEYPRLASHDLRTLRVIAYTGAALPDTIRAGSLERLCPALAEGYGLQEAGWLTVSTPTDRVRRPGSVGMPVLFADVKIVDASDEAVPVGEIGQILSRTPSSTTGYFQAPERSAETFRGGWFHTGDLGYFDQDGYLHVCGRVKDMIITGGQNVHAAEVEAALLRIPGVRECAVIGLPDDKWGERVTAVIVADVTLALESVQDFCRAMLAGFKIPRELFVQSEPLPRTPTGKVQKFLLVERLGPGR